MRRRGRVSRIAKWVATAACGLCVAVFLIRLWCNVGVEMVRPPIACVARVDWGCIIFGWQLDKSGHRYEDIFFETRPFFVRLNPSLSLDGGGVDGVAVLPFWIVILILLVPTAFLWRRDRHRRLPGHCQKCGYDLTGNVSGRCPECGAAVKRNETAHT